MRLKETSKILRSDFFASRVCPRICRKSLQNEVFYGVGDRSILLDISRWCRKLWIGSANSTCVRIEFSERIAITIYIKE